MLKAPKSVRVFLKDSGYLHRRFYPADSLPSLISELEGRKFMRTISSFTGVSLIHDIIFDICLWLLGEAS
jgi:hypothetical protein